MIITLICIFLCVLGFVFLRTNNYDLEDLGALLFAVFGIASIILLIIIGIINASGYSDARKLQMRHEGLVKQVEAVKSEYEDVSKAKVISDVYQWNQEVWEAKYWSRNPFTNWFWSKEAVDSMEYIWDI